MKKQEFLNLFEEKLSDDKESMKTREMLSAYFDVLSGQNLSDTELLSLCNPESFEMERQYTTDQQDLSKPYYDFIINDLISRTYGPYDARYFKVHIIRSGKLKFKEILSESQIIFQVSSSGPITLEELTQAKDTFTLDISTTAGFDVKKLITKNLRANIYSGKVFISIPEVLPKAYYPNEPLFNINLHNFGQLTIKLSSGQKVCLCNHGKTKIDCRVERVNSIADGDPYIYVDGGPSSKLLITY